MSKLTTKEIIKRLKNIKANLEANYKVENMPLYLEEIISDLEAEVIPEPEEPVNKKEMQRQLKELLDWSASVNARLGYEVPDLDRFGRFKDKRKIPEEHDERCGLYNYFSKEEWVCRCGKDNPKTPDSIKIPKKIDRTMAFMLDDVAWRVNDLIDYLERLEGKK